MNKKEIVSEYTSKLMKLFPESVKTTTGFNQIEVKSFDDTTAVLSVSNGNDSFTIKLCVQTDLSSGRKITRVEFDFYSPERQSSERNRTMLHKCDCADIMMHDKEFDRLLTEGFKEAAAKLTAA